MRKRVSFAVAVALLAAPALGADETIDLATLRARMTAAAGALENYRETFETTGAAGVIRTTIFRRGADERVVSGSGPLHTERGVVGGQAWHQNANGLTVADLPDTGEARGETVERTVRRLHDPERWQIVSTTKARGVISREDVDPATYLVMRRESLTPNGSVVTTYDDVRTTGGKTLAWHWSVHDEIRKTESTSHIVELAANVVTPEMVAEPPIRRALVTFPAGASKVEIPLQIADHFHIVVRVEIDGRGLDVLLDTGAPGLYIDRTVLSELGITPIAEVDAVTADRYRSGTAIVPEMHVGSLVMRNVAVTSVPLAAVERGTSAKTVGLLGFDFLATLGVSIDYERKLLTVMPAAAYTPPQATPRFDIPIRLNTGHPMVVAHVNDAVADRLMIDTGGEGSFLFFDYFARRNPGAYRGTGIRKQYEGIGGRFEVEQVRVDHLRLGRLDFTDFVGARVVSRNAFDAPQDGLIGTDFLRLFNVDLDYASGMMYLTPNSLGRRIGIR